MSTESLLSLVFSHKTFERRKNSNYRSSLESCFPLQNLNKLGLSLVPHHLLNHRTISCKANYTSFLNLIAVIFFVGLSFISFERRA